MTAVILAAFLAPLSATAAGADAAQAGEAAAESLETAVPGDTLEPFNLGSLEDYSGIVERSVFTQTRRYASAPGTAASPVATPLTAVEQGLFRLAGVVILGTAKYALLKHVQDPEYTRVEEGSVLHNWRVETIAPNEVVLSQGDFQETVALHQNVPTAVDKRKAQRKAAAAKRLARRKEVQQRRAATQDNFVRKLGEGGSTRVTTPAGQSTGSVSPAQIPFLPREAPSREPGTDKDR